MVDLPCGGSAGCARGSDARAPREAKYEPPDCRAQGPAGFASTARWLRAAFADLRFDVHDAAADGGLIAVYRTMSGSSCRPVRGYDERGGVATALPPTDRTFAVAPTRRFRTVDGRIVEHRADRHGRTNSAGCRRRRCTCGGCVGEAGRRRRWPVDPGSARRPGFRRRHGGEAVADRSVVRRRERGELVATRHGAGRVGDVNGARAARPGSVVPLF